MIMEIKSLVSFLKYYENIRNRTLRVVGVIPPEHLEWSFREGKFTIGDQVRHIAITGRYMFAKTIAGRPSAYGGCGSKFADGYDNVVQFFNDLHGESVEIFQSLSDDDLNRKCLTPGNCVMPVWKWLRAMVEHEVHHRAQIYLYLSILGVSTPPIFGLSSEEVIEYTERTKSNSYG